MLGLFRNGLVALCGIRVEQKILRGGYQIAIKAYEIFDKKRIPTGTTPRPHPVSGVSKTGVAVVVPIYNACEETAACITSILRHTEFPYQLILIDDASTDARMRGILEGFANAHPHLVIVYHEKNLGYTATINEGCRLAGSDDVVLLNNDTRVTSRWLKKLRDCAKSRSHVATVTPLSNAAGAFSIPRKNVNNRLVRGMTVDQMGAVVEKLSLKLRPSVPTGNGFCMYITRAALDAVGEFDAKNFPRGYGEENDFCMRARQRGFVHLIEDSTFIYHHRSASAGMSRRDIAPRGVRRLNALHPEYGYLVMKWNAADPLDAFRVKLQATLDEWKFRT